MTFEVALKNALKTKQAAKAETILKVFGALAGGGAGAMGARAAAKSAAGTKATKGVVDKVLDSAWLSKHPKISDAAKKIHATRGDETAVKGIGHAATAAGGVGGALAGGKAGGALGRAIDARRAVKAAKSGNLLDAAKNMTKKQKMIAGGAGLAGLGGLVVAKS